MNANTKQTLGIIVVAAIAAIVLALIPMSGHAATAAQPDDVTIAKAVFAFGRETCGAEVTNLQNKSNACVAERRAFDALKTKGYLYLADNQWLSPSEIQRVGDAFERAERNSRGAPIEAITGYAYTLDMDLHDFLTEKQIAALPESDIVTSVALADTPRVRGMLRIIASNTAGQ